MSPQIRNFPLSLNTPRAALAALLVAAPGTAFADTWDSGVSNVQPQQLVVESNGSSYHSVSGFANLAADVRVEIDTGTVGRVKSWKVWLGLGTEDGAYEGWPHYNVAKSYPWYDRPRRVNGTVQLIVPSAAWGGFVKARCNALADDLRAQGLGDTAIFAEDRKIELAVYAPLEADTTGAGSNWTLQEAEGWNLQTKIDLVCKKWAGAAVPQASNDITNHPPEVVDWSLAIAERSGLNGVCKIRLKGAIATDQANAEVSFRYKDKAGHQSQVWTVNTGAAKFTSFTHWYNVPNGAGPETGSVRMVGVSHDFSSQWVDYEMDCVEGGPGTLTSNDPPKLTIKSIEEEGKVMIDGQICPERLRLVGEVEGRGNFSGHAAFVSTSGPLWFSPPQAYDLDDGETQLVVGYYPLWKDQVFLVGKPGPLAFSRSFAFRATKADNNAIIAAVDRTYASECKPPKRNPVLGGGHDGLTVEPRRPAAPTGPRVLQQRPQPATPAQRLQMRQAN